MACLNVDALFPGYTVTVYPPDRVDAVELTMAMTGKERKYCVDILSKISDDIFNSANFARMKLPGEGNRKTKTLYFKDAIELIMVLPGKVAKQTRQQFADIITRYFAGDASLIPEVQANAASENPVNVMARAALENDDPTQIAVAVPTAVGNELLAPVENLDPTLRKRQLEREDMLLALEVDERRRRLELEVDERRRRLEIEVDERRQLLKANALGDVRTGIEIIKMLYPAGPMDERFAMQMEDLVKNILFTPGQAPMMIDNGALQSSVNPTQSISVSVVVAEMGFTKATDAQVQAIGKRMAAKYREAYGSEPTKHKQYVKGNYIQVNSYTEKDRGMMQSAVREVLQG